MYWLERNFSKEVEEEEGEVGSSRSRRSASRAATIITSSPDLLPGTSSKKLDNRWTLDYLTSQCDSEGGGSTSKNSLRRVSFAPCKKEDEGQEAAELVSPLPVLEKAEAGRDDSIEVPTSSVGEVLEEESDDASASEGFEAVSVVNKERETMEMERQKEEEEVVEPITPQPTPSPLPRPIYYAQPKLSPRDYPPPSPPVVVAPDLAHYKRASSRHPATKSHLLLDRKTQSEEDCLSYHIKKKLLALKLHERASKRQGSGVGRLRLMAVTSSQASSGSDTRKGKRGLGKVRRRPVNEKDFLSRPPVFHSTPDSDTSLLLDDESNPTVYYTPKQSLQDFKEAEMPILPSSAHSSHRAQVSTPTWSNDSKLASKQDGREKKGALESQEAKKGEENDQDSVDSSSSAPSFLIGSSTQLCQCIGEKDSSPNAYKTLLDRLTSSGGGKSSRSSDKTNSYLTTPENRSTACCHSSKDATSSSIPTTSEPSLCPKEVSSSFISSTPASRGSAYSNSKELSSSSSGAPGGDTTITSESSKHSLSTTTASIDMTEITSQGSKICSVDEEWWQKFEACLSEQPHTEAGRKSGGNSKTTSSSSAPSTATASTSKPVVREIELDKLLSRLYPELPHLDESANEDNACTMTVESPSTATTSIRIVEDSELQDLVEILGEMSDLSAGNVTTYTQEEMSLDLECAGCNLPEPLLALDGRKSCDVTNTAPPKVCQQPPSPSPSPQHEHVSIDMPEDLSLVLYEKCDVAKSESSTATSQEYIQPYGEFVSHEQEPGEKVEETQEEGWTSLSADLIDINFTEGEKMETSEGTAWQPWPPTERDWATANISADGMLFSDAQRDAANRQSLKTEAETVTTPPVHTPLDCTDPSMRDARLSLQKNLSDIAKKEAEKEKEEEEGEGEWSSNSSGRSFLVDSLCLATDILEKSHYSLSKSVHGLRQRAIIKQSNVSLDLILPSERLHDDKSPDKSRDGKVFGSPNGKASKLNVQLNSSIVYPPSDADDIF